MNFGKLNQDVPYLIIPQKHWKLSCHKFCCLYRTAEILNMIFSGTRYVEFTAKTDGDWRQSKGWASVYLLSEDNVIAQQNCNASHTGEIA